jgi:tight adherence protein C
MTPWITLLAAKLTTTEWILIGCAAAIGIAAFLVVKSLYPERFLEEVREKAKEQRDGERIGPVGGVAERRPSAMRAAGSAFVGKIGDYCDPLVKQRFRDKMGRRYLALGKPEYRAQDFVAQQFLYALLFGLLGLLVMNMIKKPFWFSTPFIVFGWFFPHIALRDQIKKRANEIRKKMPYHIDLLTLSVEAGLDFGGALQTVVDKGQPGPLIEELSIVLSEMKLGKTREEALRNFADRVQILEVSTFVSNLVQADKMGTSMGKVLRIQSGQMRVARAQRAEKLANEAPVKMLLPLVLCFFPTVFMVLFGPIVFRLFYGGGP